jgi:two-component system nitrate/nitrite response regulator NarL
MSIEVVAADAEPLYVDGLVAAVGQAGGLSVVAAVSDAHAALAAIREHRPAVALLARGLVPLSGERILSAVVRDGLPTRVVLLDAAPGADVLELLGAGAAGVLSRRLDRLAICGAVRRVAAGGIALCPDAQAAVARESRARRPRERRLVSPRESEVLQLVADGLTAPQIAARLQLATTTARTHLAHLRDKLGACDRAQLVANAMRLELLE